MASGDRVQIVLSAKDEISTEIRETRKNIKSLEKDLNELAKQDLKSNAEARKAYQEKRKSYDEAKRSLGELARKNADLTRKQREYESVVKSSNRAASSAFDNVTRKIGATGGAVDRMSRALKASEERAYRWQRTWSRSIDTVKRKIDKFSSSSLNRAATGAVFAAGAGAVGLGAIGLKTASDLEQTQISFEQMLGSADKATKMVEWLKKTAAKTPFELRGLNDATQRLLSYGFNAKRARESLLTIGNAAAATGKGAEGVERVSTAIGQMNAKQKIQTEEMLQLVEAGVPAWKLLAKEIGMTVPELQEMMSSQGGAAKLFEQGGLDALLDGMADKYDGLMEKQSKTLSGLWSTLKDTISLAAADIVEEYMPAIKRAMRSAINGVSGAFDTAKKVIDKVGPVIKGIVEFITAPDNATGFKVMAIAIGVMTAAMWALNLAMAANPITWIILGIGALIGLVVWAWQKFDDLRSVIVGVGGAALLVAAKFLLVAKAAAPFAKVVWFAKQLGFAMKAGALAAQVLGSTVLRMLLGPLGKLIWLGKQVAFVLKAVAIGVQVLGRAFIGLLISNPIGLIIIAVVALIAGLVLLWKKNEGFRRFILAAWEAIKKAVAAAIEFVIGYYKTLWQVAKIVFSGLVNVVRTGWDKVTGFFTKAKDKVVSIVTKIKDGLKGIWDGLTDGLRDKIDTIKNFLKGIPGWSLIDGLFFAGGPVAAGTTNLVGEIGPEIFVPNAGSPSWIGKNGPEVRDFHQSGVIIPNHLAVQMASPALVGAGAPVAAGGTVTIENLHVRDDIDVEATLVRAQLRAERIARERR